MSSLSSGLLCQAPSDPPGHEEGQENSQHHCPILSRALLHPAPSPHCKYSQGKENCPCVGQTLPLQGSRAGNPREEPGAAVPGGEEAAHQFWESLSIPSPSFEGQQQHRVETGIFPGKFRASFCCGKVKSKNSPVEGTSSLEMPLSCFILIVSNCH